MWKSPTGFPAPGMAIIGIAAGITVLCSAHPALPHSFPAGDGSGKRSCLYVTELQKSVTARQRFLAALDATGTEAGGRAAENTHAKTAPASYPDTTSVAGYPGRAITGNSAAEGVAGLDDFSVQCLSCHDGKGASDVAVVLRNAPLQKKSHVTSFSMDHPLGMEYRRYAASGSGFKQALEGSRMTMVNGRVGCLTCHNPLNPERGHLAISDHGSALCLTCHDR
jgi:predicted CXXCH cytochrome family protein